MADLSDFMDGFVPTSDGEFDKFEGRFHCVIDNLKIEKKDAGTCASVVLKVKGPTHANRLVWDNCWMTHANPKAANVGRSKLHKYATTLGISPNSDKDAYIGEELIATFKINGEFQNVDKIEPIDKASSPAPAVAQTESATEVSADGEGFFY